MMEIAFNWIEIITWLLLIGGGIGSIGLAIDWAQSTKTPNDVPVVVRSSDAPPPAGSQEWVVDIIGAMASASAESKIAALVNGSTRDEARSRRIAELEGPPA